MSRTALFDAIRPLAPNGRFTQDQVGLIDQLADTFGMAREASAPTPQASPAAFFADVRAAFGALSQSQVDGFNALLAATAHWPTSWRAYALATAWHETAATMQPIKERGTADYFRRMYDLEGQRPEVAKRLGNRLPGDGAKYAGRGYVQLTGRANYAVYGLTDRPDDAMKPDVAARILVDGMEKGRFTGRGLGDYLPRDGRPDYVNARRIINGVDRAEQIAGYARTFEGALT